jgi:hypothetical protein
MSIDKPGLPANHPALLWSGRAISSLAVLALLASAYFKFMPPPGTEEGLAHIGWPMKLMFAIGITEVACTILYAIPQTSVLGAILITGYLGGATATHVRVGDNFIAPIVIGIVVWVGLYLREPRLRALAPLRTLS